MKNPVLFIKEKYYLIIPLISLSIWCLLVLIHEDFFLSIINTLRYDFLPLYNAGKEVYLNPSLLYDVTGYYYLPIFAVVYGALFSWIPINMVWYVHYTFVFILAILSLLEFNKILKLLKLEQKYLRVILNTFFMFGWPIYLIFYLNQAKFIVVLSILFIIRREIQYRNLEKEKTLSYFIINYSLLAFSLSITPYLIFLGLVFVLNDIDVKKVFNKSNLSRILVFLFVLIIQNFLFLFFPHLIIEFFEKGLDHGLTTVQVMIFWNVDGLNSEVLSSIKIISFISMGLLTLYFWLLKNNLSIEKKLGYFTLALLYLDAWKGYVLLLISLPCIYILLVPVLKQLNTWKIYKNIPLLIFFLSVFMILIQMTYNETFFQYFPFLQDYPFILLVYFRWFVPILLMSLSFLYINLKKEGLNTDSFEKSLIS